MKHWCNRVIIVAVMAALAACGQGREDSNEHPGGAEPTPTVGAVLTREDLATYTAVRSRALQRSEETLARLERGEISPVAAVEDFASADRRAAALLGVEWRRYALIREEVGRAISEQRRREDSRLLVMELERALEEMRVQHRQARDAATREFVQAQIASLERQLERLAREEDLLPEEEEQRAMLDRVRADLAMQAGRQERLQRRLRELLQAHGLGTLELPVDDASDPENTP